MENNKLKKELLKSGVNITDKYVAFWGSVFSNFYPCKFKINGLLFYNSEQCFMWQKAMHFNDQETAEKILHTIQPVKAKGLGRQVKNFDQKSWEDFRELAMYNAVYAKFSQNQDLRDIITAEEFDGKSFVEGSPEDCIWGVGIEWNDPEIEDKDNWQGLNLLGKTLDKVREQLLSEK